MDRKIKTRQVHKDIKVLDKTVTVTDHVKQSYVRTKENIMQSTEKSSDRENNPVGYAEDAASKYADRIFHETGHQVRRQAGKIIERKKEKASVSSTGEETVYQPKEEIRPVPPSGGETAQEQGKELAVKKIKTIERDKPTCTIPNPNKIIPMARISPKINVDRLLITVSGSSAANTVLAPAVIISTIAIYTAMARFIFAVIGSFFVDFVVSFFSCFFRISNFIFLIASYIFFLDLLIFLNDFFQIFIG